jgi:hypothetical protein
MFTPMCSELRRFLQERGLYLRFIINLIICAESINNYIKVKRSLAVCKPHAIAVAFDWDKSFEGEYYWNSVSRKWEIWYGTLLTGGFIEPYIRNESDNNEKSNR